RAGGRRFARREAFERFDVGLGDAARRATADVAGPVGVFGLANQSCGHFIARPGFGSDCEPGSLLAGDAGPVGLDAPTLDHKHLFTALLRAGDYLAELKLPGRFDTPLHVGIGRWCLCGISDLTIARRMRIAAPGVEGLLGEPELRR